MYRYGAQNALIEGLGGKTVSNTPPEHWVYLQARIIIKSNET